MISEKSWGVILTVHFGKTNTYSKSYQNILHEFFSDLSGFRPESYTKLTLAASRPLVRLANLTHGDQLMILGIDFVLQVLHCLQQPPFQLLRLL